MEVEKSNKSIEGDLLSSTGCQKVFWFGRGTTALFFAFRAIIQKRPDVQQPEIIIPSILCPTPANVALMAGLKPRFADIDLNTGLISFESVKIIKSKNTVALLAVHLYGNAIDLAQFIPWCKKENIVIIEDNAQSLGGILPDKKPVGSYGDYSIYSFNITKILEGGGGALIVRNSNDTSVVDSLVNVPFYDISDEKFRQLSDSYRNLHHSMITLLRHKLISPQRINEFILNITRAYDGLFLRNFHNKKLYKEWMCLEHILQERQIKAEKYQTLLSSLPLNFISNFKQSGICWRFTVLYSNEDKLVEASEAIRNEGFHVSNLYWPLNQFYNTSDHCPNAELFGKRVLNFWLDSRTDSSWIEKCCESIRKNLS